MYSRVQRLYIAFVLVGLIVIVRLLWVLFFSAEISTNAQKIDERIFVRDTIHP